MSEKQPVFDFPTPQQVATFADFEAATKRIIDELKSVCATFGLGNDGNEFKIITQVFLYKFLNDKFIASLKKASPNLRDLTTYTPDEYQLLLARLPADVARFEPNQLIETLFNSQNEANFDTLFDNVFTDLAQQNFDIFSVITDTGEKIMLFEPISKYVIDNRAGFCKAIINKLVSGVSFERVFEQKFDFFAMIFEYLIKDYNSNSGGKYAEYFTPHAVAKIMAQCLVTEPVKNVSCYDPSAGSGTLLMNIAHAIGEQHCTIYAQDISQKSSNLLRLNLIINGLVHSVLNVVKGNTILNPQHKDRQGEPRKFDFIVSNPPFKLDFSDYVAQLIKPANRERFFAGAPNVPKAKKEGMAIYPMFIQHIIWSLKANGRAAIVVPTGFITAQSGIERKIREKMVEEKMLRGVISMPSNIFATTGTNVSILFLDKANSKGDIVLMDASKLGTTIKDGKNQKTVLSPEEEQRVISTFNQHKAEDDFTVVVSYDDIKEKNYSFSAGQYFEVKIEYTDISPDQFKTRMQAFNSNLDQLFQQSKDLEAEIKQQLGGLKYE